MAAETDPVKQKEMSNKIFKAQDADLDEYLDKKEMIVLVQAFPKAIPSQMKSMMKQLGMSKSEEKQQLNDFLFNALDADGDGKVTFEERHAAITAVA